MGKKSVIDIDTLGLDFFRQLAGQTPAGICVIRADGCPVFVNPAFEAITGASGLKLQSDGALQIFPERERQEAKEELEKASLSERRHWGTRVLRPSGEHRDVEAIALAVTVAGEEARALLLLDVTDTRRLALKVSTINAFARSLSVAGTIQELLDHLARNLVESTDALAGVVLLAEAAPPRVVAMGGYGIARPIQQVPFEIGGPLREVFESGEPLMSSQAESLVGLLGEVALDPLWGATVVVPIKVREKTLGLVACAYRRCFQPDSAEITFVKTLAALAGVEIEHVRLVEAVQQQAVAEERQRLGRELHDSVSQTLYGIGLGAQAALEALPICPQEASESIRYVLKLVEGGLTEMRSLLYKLRPEFLENEGLVEALGNHVQSLAKRHRFELEAVLGEEPDLPVSIKHAAYRVAMEAIHNVVKHAQASRVKLGLRSEPQGLELVIEDNGHGFDLQPASPERYGLRSMRERVQALGGSLEIESQLGRGTTVKARIPTELKTEL